MTRLYGLPPLFATEYAVLIMALKEAAQHESHMKDAILELVQLLRGTNLSASREIKNEER